MLRLSNMTFQSTPMKYKTWNKKRYKNKIDLVVIYIEYLIT